MNKQEVKWNEGPARGGQGTAGKDRWWDGDLLLIIVETNDGNDTDVVSVHADEDYLNLQCSNGDAYGWEPSDISWWAKLGNSNTPTNPAE
jgi:hypothetical protein